MIKKLLIVTLVPVVIFFSCKKEELPVTPLAVEKSTSAIIVPPGFTWENSRNINFTVIINGNRFPGIIHVISIYDGDPAKGGNLLSKGSATNIAAYKSKIYLSKQIGEVYIVAAFPDGTKTTQKLQINSNNLITSI